MEYLIPTSYTSSEGGVWQNWPLAELAEEFFARRDPSHIKILHPEGRAIIVHALRFRDRRVWDCINGWRNQPQRSSPRARSIKSVRVTQYETLDGKRFSTHWEANRHEVVSRIQKLLTSFDLTDLLANADEISKLLRKYHLLTENITFRATQGDTAS